MSRRLLWPAALLLAGAPVWAHDYWLMPSRLVVPPGSEVSVALLLGEGLTAEEQRGLQLSRTVRFEHLEAAGTRDLLAGGAEGAQPVARLRLTTPGGHLLAMERNAAHLTLEATRFNAHLRAEGLLAPLAERGRRGESGAPGRERYTRYLKALVQVGDAHDELYSRVLGHTLELVPLSDPARARPGSSLGFEVRFRGAPLPNVQLEAHSRVGSTTATQRLQSDAAGRVTVAIDREGVWALRLTHMLRCESCVDADWQSYWSSYVFGVCAAGAACAGVQ